MGLREAIKDHSTNTWKLSINVSFCDIYSFNKHRPSIYFGSALSKKQIFLLGAQVGPIQDDQANKHETKGSSRILLTINSAVWTVSHAASQHLVINGLAPVPFNFHSPSSHPHSKVSSITLWPGWTYQLWIENLIYSNLYMSYKLDL